MCGISGEVRFDGRPADIEAVARMSGVLSARGPDGSGLWARDHIAFGHRRLKIIDLSEHASQPMVDPELGLTVVFNGCIYNYRQLRDELAGHGYRFFSHGDTEVILKAYHHWGERFVDHLLGMFAVVIAERDSGRVVLARDRLGIKPLYLSETPHRLRFASSLPSLLAGGDVDRTIDTTALHHYLSFHSVVPAPHTILAGVRKLPPATLRVIEASGQSREWRYWTPPYTRDAARAGRSESEWVDEVLEGVRRAVERRLVADVPVGVLLSGGLDSSLVVGLLAELGQPGLATFSIGFEAAGGQAGDEFQYSDVIARHYGTDHHQIRIGTDRLIPALQGAIGAMSEPMVSHDVVAFYLLSQEVSKHIKVVQSGQGADEVFAGYHWYPPLADLPADAARERAIDTYARAFLDRSHAEMATVLDPAWQITEDVSREFVAAHFHAPHADTPLDAALRLDTEIMLVDDPVKRVDNMTMAWGLEARVPFLDHELVELAATVPPEYKIAHGGKGVLKQAARRLIPAEVIDRPKGYFPVPALTYLDGPALDMVRDALTAPAAKERNLFRREYVDGLLADPNAQLTPLRGNKLWQLGLLELWLQAHRV